MAVTAGDVEMKAVSRKKKTQEPAQIAGGSLDELILQAAAQHRAAVAKERCAFSQAHLHVLLSEPTAQYSSPQRCVRFYAGRKGSQGGKEAKPRKAERSTG